MRSLYVSGKLPTYPSPKPTLPLTSQLGQNVGLGEGYKRIKMPNVIKGPMSCYLLSFRKLKRVFASINSKNNDKCCYLTFSCVQTDAITPNKVGS